MWPAVSSPHWRPQPPLPVVWRAKLWGTWWPQMTALVLLPLATSTRATSPQHHVVNNNSQTTDLIFCKREKIIEHFHVGGSTHTYTMETFSVNLTGTQP